MKTVNVLEDVRLAVGDKDDVQLIERLVDEAHIILFDDRVLGSRISQLGEGCEQGFNSRTSDFPELA